jgi:hypothetical protein
MAKLIVERPRIGGGGRSFPLRVRPDCHRLDMEEWRSRESIRRPWLHGRKSLNENLAPLHRYLRAQVGRPWNKVYSEICQHINRNSAVQLHIWQHLMRDVRTDIQLMNSPGGIVWGYPLFIIETRTGLLRENPVKRRRIEQAPVSNPDRVAGEGNIQYHRIDGIWYELQLAWVPRSRDVYDFGLRQNVKYVSDTMLGNLYGTGRVYGAAKRQLNKKEIRLIGLTHGA